MIIEPLSLHELVAGVYTEAEWLSLLGEREFGAYREFCSDLGHSQVIGRHIARVHDSGSTVPCYVDQRKGRLVAVPEDLHLPAIELNGSEARFLCFSIEALVEKLRKKNAFESTEAPLAVISPWLHVIGTRTVARAKIIWLLLKPAVGEKDIAALKLVVRNLKQSKSFYVISAWKPEEFSRLVARAGATNLAVVEVPSASKNFYLAPSKFCRKTFEMAFDEVLMLLEDRDLIIDQAAREVFLFREKLSISPIYFPIISYLAQNSGTIFSASALVERTNVSSDRDDATLIRQMRSNLSSALKKSFLNKSDLMTRAEAIFPDGRGSASIQLPLDHIFFWT